MKIRSISLKNFAKYAQVTASFDPSVTYLVGKNGAGKSTIGITGIHFMFQGIAEQAKDGKKPIIGERFRFIGPSAASANGEMVLYDEKDGTEVKVMRKLTKTGTELSFEGPEGKVLDQAWLNDLFNLFLIAPKRFTELSSIDQARALGVDTSTYDAELQKVKDDYKVVNRMLKELGTPEPVEATEDVELSDIMDEFAALQKENEDIRRQAEGRVRLYNGVTAIKNIIDADQQKIDALMLQVNALRENVDMNKARVLKNEEYIASLPQPQQEKPMDDINLRIKQVSETKAKAQRYKTYKEQAEKIKQKNQELADNLKLQAKKSEARAEYIRGFKFPFSNITIGEGGELLLNLKPIKEPHFSTGELIKTIPILISSQRPELKYIFLQDFNLLDEQKQTETLAYFTERDFQVVVEYIDTNPLPGKNCILLRDNQIVDVSPEGEVDNREALV